MRQLPLLLLILIAGCAKLDNGKVTSKRYHPTETYTYNCGCAMQSDDGITCLVPVECEGVHPERWTVYIDGYTATEKPITTQIEVSKTTFDRCVPGTLVYRNERGKLQFEFQ